MKDKNQTTEKMVQFNASVPDRLKSGMVITAEALNISVQEAVVRAFLQFLNSNRQTVVKAVHDITLALFCGVRPVGELEAADWRDVNLDTATITIEAPKVRRRRRIVPIAPNAVALLKPLAKLSGPIIESKYQMRVCKERLAKELGLKAWPQDLLRHTAASYLLALHKDAAKVALMLGNSPAILLTHYHVPVTDEACKEFWKI